jgi:hypothetical protein
MKSAKIWVKLHKKYEILYTILLQKDRLSKLKTNNLDFLLTDKQSGERIRSKIKGILNSPILLI